MQKKILIIIAIIVMLGVAIGLTVFVLQKAKPTTNTNANMNTTNTVVSNKNTVIINKKVLSEEDKQKIEIIRLANIFAEHYGTYNGALSTDNVNGFKDMVTTALLTQIQKQVNDQLAASSRSSILTTALSTTIQSFTKGTGAVVSVSTLRKQSTTTTNSVNAAPATTQTLTLGFFFLDSAWKIQSAQWGAPATAPSVNQ